MASYSYRGFEIRYVGYMARYYVPVLDAWFRSALAAERAIFQAGRVSK